MKSARRRSIPANKSTGLKGDQGRIMITLSNEFDKIFREKSPVFQERLISFMRLVLRVVLFVATVPLMISEARARFFMNRVEAAVDTLNDFGKQAIIPRRGRS